MQWKEHNQIQSTDRDRPTHLWPTRSYQTRRSERTPFLPPKPPKASFKAGVAREEALYIYWYIFGFGDWENRTPNKNNSGARNHSLQIFGCLLLKCGWTEVGRKIQSLYKFCPDSVQSLSNNRSCTESVQSLSKSGPNCVKPMTNFKQRGQTLDIRIQSLSKVCPNQLRK